DLRSNVYFWAWIIAEPILWLFYVLLVVELSRSVLAQYRGLYTVFRIAMLASAVISVGISIASLIPRLQPAMSQRSKKFLFFMATQRALDLSLAVFIVLILFFFC